MEAHDAVEDPLAPGLRLGAQIVRAGQRLTFGQIAVKNEVASLRRDPVRVAVMRVDAQADALARLRPGAVAAKRDHRIAGIAHAANSVEVEHGMSARSARHDLGAEAGLLADLRERAEFGVPGVNRRVCRFTSIFVFGPIETRVRTPAERK